MTGQPITRPPKPVGYLRWMVRLEHVKPHPFGSSARRAGSIAWAVTPYAGRFPDGRIKGVGAPTYFDSRSRALAWARNECARVYRRKR